MLPLLAAGGTLAAGGALSAGGMIGGMLNSSPDAPQLETELGKVFKLLYGGKKWAKGLNRGGMWEGDQPGALDDLLRLQTETAPQFEQARLDALRQTAPQVAQLQFDLYNQFAPQYAQTQADTQRGLNQPFYSQQDQMMQQLGGRVGQGLSPEALDFFAARTRAGQAVRGIADSPLGSTQEARYLTELDLGQQQQNIANMQNFMNTYRTVNPQMPGVGVGNSQLGQYDQWQSPSFQELFSTSVANRGSQFQSDMAQYGNEQEMWGSLAGIGGSMLGGALGGIGGGTMGGY